MGESLEVQSLRALASFIGARVTDTITPGVHAPTSYHYATGTGGEGLAIDLAEMSGPSHDTPGLQHIAATVAGLIGAQCAELIYAGGPTLRNGKPFQYSSTVLSAHHNHVHVAVNRGFRFVHVTKEAPVPDPSAPPVYEVASAPVSISVVGDGSGYLILTADGGVYAFGTATYLGGVRVKS